MIPRIATTVTLALTVLLIGLLTACTAPQTEDIALQAGAEGAAAPPSRSLPPSEAQALAALESSPRHGEWVDIDLPGSAQPLRTWVVYPERADPAPAVLVIQEIYGMTDWIRAVADQLAADGFIALAPDLLSGKGPGGGGTESAGSRDAVVALVRSLTPEETVSRLNAAREYARGLPAASGTIAAIGFCWGGGASFAYAVAQAGLDAAVVYYGTSPADTDVYAQIHAAVLGLYGGDDARVNATIPTAEGEMARLGKTYEPNIYEGAGHGFLRAQEDRDGANMMATEQAWPRTVEFLRQHTE